MKNSIFSYLLLFVLIFILFGCTASQTQLNHSGHFSNIRSEVILNGGELVHGYSSLNAVSGNKHIEIRVPGEKLNRFYPLSEVEKVLFEDQQFEVKWIESPVKARKEGKPDQVQTMLKLLHDYDGIIQVYEYKYPVKNPKSPVNSINTAFYVSFPEQPENVPLTTFNTESFKNQWLLFMESCQENESSALRIRVPASTKAILNQMNALNLSGQKNTEASK